MNKYQKGKIYAIKCIDNDEVYIGSTIQELHERLLDHIYGYYGYVEGNGKYITSFEIIDTGNYFIELIKDFPCNSRKELRQEEGRIQKEMDCVNIIIAGRTPHEYYRDNIVILTERKSERIECECGGSYRRDNKSHHYKSRLHLKKMGA